MWNYVLRTSILSLKRSNIELLQRQFWIFIKYVRKDNIYIFLVLFVNNKISEGVYSDTVFLSDAFHFVFEMKDLYWHFKFILIWKIIAHTEVIWELIPTPPTLLFSILHLTTLRRGNERAYVGCWAKKLNVMVHCLKLLICYTLNEFLL